jgi:hypothetical protein
VVCRRQVDSLCWGNQEVHFCIRCSEWAGVVARLFGSLPVCCGNTFRCPQALAPVNWVAQPGSKVNLVTDSIKMLVKAGSVQGNSHFTVACKPVGGAGGVPPAEANVMAEASMYEAGFDIDHVKVIGDVAL